MGRYVDKRPGELRFGAREVPFEPAFGVSIETGQVLVDKWGVSRMAVNQAAVGPEPGPGPASPGLSEEAKAKFRAEMLEYLAHDAGLVFRVCECCPASRAQEVLNTAGAVVRLFGGDLVIRVDIRRGKQ